MIHTFTSRDRVYDPFLIWSNMILAVDSPSPICLPQTFALCERRMSTFTGTGKSRHAEQVGIIETKDLPGTVPTSDSPFSPQFRQGETAEKRREALLRNVLGGQPMANGNISSLSSSQQSAVTCSCFQDTKMTIPSQALLV